ncbi:hypothetical protein AFLA_013309 [Aspergillus flavus NRRL3357]|nr:hypothetical protein AFLA_013309 [Aspergillus flavus NRRL3357]
MIYVLGLSNRGPRGPRIPPWVLEPALLADLNFPIDFLMYIDSLIGLQRRMERTYKLQYYAWASSQAKQTRSFVAIICYVETWNVYTPASTPADIDA